jgi:hypothetical protein
MERHRLNIGLRKALNVPLTMPGHFIASLGKYA